MESEKTMNDEIKRVLLLSAVGDWYAAARIAHGEDEWCRGYHLGRYQGTRDALLAAGVPMAEINAALDAAAEVTA